VIGGRGGGREGGREGGGVDGLILVGGGRWFLKGVATGGCWGWGFKIRWMDGWMGWDVLFLLCMTGLFYMLMAGVCMYRFSLFFFLFFFPGKEKKRKGENYCSRPLPNSPVFNFRSPRVSFAEEDDLDRDVVSV